MFIFQSWCLNAHDILLSRFQQIFLKPLVFVLFIWWQCFVSGLVIWQLLLLSNILIQTSSFVKTQSNIVNFCNVVPVFPLLMFYCNICLYSSLVGKSVTVKYDCSQFKNWHLALLMDATLLQGPCDLLVELETRSDKQVRLFPQ